MAESIQYFNRYTNRIETERVYGERWLRWMYGQRSGRFGLAIAAKRAWFSRWYGAKMQDASSAGKIEPFISKYGVDVDSMAQRPSTYESFNAFFMRRLKPEARPVAQGLSEAVFPADARHLGFPDLSVVDHVFVKGQRFDIKELVGDGDLAEKYAHGTLLLSRLCPVDYHRFHFPVAGTPSQAEEIDGSLYSVSPIALRRRLDILWENRRMRTAIETPDWGTVLMIEIGATCVGSIIQNFTSGAPAEKGSEKGVFSFGGSSVITLFEPGRIRLADDLLEHSAQGRELYAHMGDVFGVKP